MKFQTPDKTELMNVSALEHDGNMLVIKGKIFGAMPMTAKLTPAEARQGLKLINLKMAFFLLTFLFRK